MAQCDPIASFLRAILLTSISALHTTYNTQPEPHSTKHTAQSTFSTIEGGKTNAAVSEGNCVPAYQTPSEHVLCEGFLVTTKNPVPSPMSARSVIGEYVMAEVSVWERVECLSLFSQTPPVSFGLCFQALPRGRSLRP